METKKQKRIRKILFAAMREVEEFHLSLNAERSRCKWHVPSIPFPTGVLGRMFSAAKSVVSAESIQDAVNRDVRKIKSELVFCVDRVRSNAQILNQAMNNHAHLFPGYSTLILEKERHELRNIIDGRIVFHRAQCRLDGIRRIVRILPERAEQYRAERERLEAFLGKTP